MPFCSVDEFAQRLGLSPGSDAGAASLLSAEEVAAVTDDLMETIRIIEKSALASEFASLYLPSFLRTVFGNTFEIGTYRQYFVWSWYIERAVDAMNLCHPMSQRFVRLHELESRSFFVQLSQWIPLVSESPQNRDDDPHQFLPRIISLFDAFATGLMLEGSPSFTSYPQLATSDRVQFTSVAQQVRRRDPKVVAPSFTGDGGAEGLAVTMDLFSNNVSLDAMDMTKSRLTTIAAHPYIAWWKCEDRSSNESRASHQHEEENEKMMACSRCFAVRYCCKDHQRVDWKRLKKLCFKPSW